ncbi:MAG: acylphosphatase [Dehalococcoidia bacterium]|nr:acylphosphatase [Dehalococcoidia bacterium]
MVSRGRQRQIVALAEGHVQGVGYRAFCAHEASLFGVTGYAQNLPDGRVRVVAEADEGTLRQFVERLREGPPMSVVRQVTFQWEDYTGDYPGFEAVI